MRTRSIALFCVLSATAASPAHAERALRYSSWLPTGHWVNTEAMQPWMAEVAEKSGGAVEIELLPKMVGTPPTQFDVCRDGLADICLVVAGYTPGRFPLAESGELPFLGNDPAAMSPKYDAFYREHFLAFDEFEGVHPLAFIKATAGDLYTRADKSIDGLDSVRGLKIRAAGPVTSAELELLGAVPILKSSNEAYELLAGGIIDGSMMFPETIYAGNSVELLGNGLRVPGGFFSTTMIVVINQDVWDGLDATERDAITAVSGAALSARFGDAYAAVDATAQAAIDAAGYTITMADGALLEEIRTVLKPVDDAWIARASAVGVPDPAAVLEDLRKTMAE